MTPLISHPRLAAFVLSEADGQRSRENVLVTRDTDDAIPSGTVLMTVSGKYVPYDGVSASVATGILYSHVPAGTGDVEAVAFVRDCEVNRRNIIGLDNDAIADLNAVGVIVRGDPTALTAHTPAL